MPKRTEPVNSEDRPRFIKTGLAARVLGVTTKTVCAAVRRGDLPGIDLGTQVLVNREGFERLVGQAGEPASVT